MSRTKTQHSILGIGLFLFVSMVGCNAFVASSTPTLIASPGVTSIGTFPAPNLGVVIDAKMKVLFVEPGNNAERAGIQAGDRILKMRNIEITSPKQARDIFYKSGFSKPLPVVLDRNGQILNLDIPLEYRARQRGAATPTPVPPDQSYF